MDIDETDRQAAVKICDDILASCARIQAIFAEAAALAKADADKEKESA